MALYLAVGGRGLGLVKLSCSRFLFLSQARLLSARDLQHLTWRLSCCLLEVGHRNVLDLAASDRLGHLCFSWHVWSRCSFLRNFDLFLKLFVITSTRSFQDVRISSGTTLVQNSRGKNQLVFAVISVRMSLSVCIQRLKFNLAGDRIYPNSFFHNLAGERETSVHIRSFTILLFALIVLLRDCSS